MKNEEKELYEIAKIAYFETTSACESDWKAVAQAVIAEHKRRKAIERNAPKTVASASMVPPHKFALPPMHDTEQVKPEWKLPDPPEGEQWQEVILHLEHIITILKSRA